MRQKRPKTTQNPRDSCPKRPISPELACGARRGGRGRACGAARMVGWWRHQHFVQTIASLAAHWVVVGNAPFLLKSLPAHFALVRARPIRRSPAPLGTLRPLRLKVALKCRQWLTRPPPSAAHSRWLSGQRGRRDPNCVKVVGRGPSWGCRRCCWRRRRSRSSRRVKGLPCRGGRGKVVICGAQLALRLQRQRRGGTCT